MFKKSLSICAAMVILALAAGCVSRETASSSDSTSVQTTATTVETTTAATTPETTAETAEEGKIVDGVYKNADPAYSIKLPEGWKVSDSVAGTAMFVAADYPATSDNMNIEIADGTVSDPDLMKSMFEAMFSQLGEDFKWVSYETAKLGNLSGIRMEYTLTMMDIPMVFIQYMVDDGSKSYTLTATLTDENSPNKQAIIDSMESFRLG
jgi:hypothetical protein